MCVCVEYNWITNFALLLSLSLSVWHGLSMDFRVSPEDASRKFGERWPRDGAINVDQGIVVSKLCRVEVALLRTAKEDDGLGILVGPAGVSVRLIVNYDGTKGKAGPPSFQNRATYTPLATPSTPRGETRTRW